MALLGNLLNTLYRPLLIHRHITPPAEIALTGFGLGTVFMFCLTLVYHSVVMPSSSEYALGPWAFALACYLLLSVCYYHMAEFLVAAQYRPHDTSPMAFMIYHSIPYLVAQFAAYLEFSLGVLYLPSHWKPLNIYWIAFWALLATGFYTIRVVGMVQCASNFSLQIEHDHRPEHKLVKTGLYAIFRHPAYFGWFYYSILTQCILLNPICLCAFAFVAWYFFKDRIPYEEDILASREFFGREYLEYKKRTIVGIPFIKNYDE